MDLNGRTALVTGASRGIGKAVAKRLAASGAKIGLNFVNNEKMCEEFAEELRKEGAQVLTLKGDVSKAGVAESISEKMVEAFGKIDILVNNAGIVRDGTALAMRDEDWKSVIDVNISGTFYMCKAAARYMMMQRYGRIINVSSFVARFGNRGQANYAASKGAVDALTRALAVELGSKGITVNAVAPGAIETDMSSHLIENHREKLVSAIPLKRIGKVEDVASIIHYLSLEESGYITGEVIGVTGGLGLWGNI